MSEPPTGWSNAARTQDATGRRAGRERHQRIVDLVAAGNHLNTAAHAAGIGESTLYLWLHWAGTPPSPASLVVSELAG